MWTVGEAWGEGNGPTIVGSGAFWVLPVLGCLRRATPLEGFGHLKQASWRVGVLPSGHCQVHRELLEGQDLQDG